VPSGVVDIGWFGNMQRSLCRILSLSERPAAANVTGFYFGLFAGTRAPTGPTMLDYWERSAGQLPRIDRYPIVLLEAFAAADHGSVVGYERSGNRLRPRLVQARNEAAEGWGLPSLHSSTQRFAEVFSGICARNQVPIRDFQLIIAQGFHRFCFHPTRREAEVWGSFPLTDRQIDVIQGQVVPRWNTAQTVAALLDFRRRPTGWWPEGTLASGGSPFLALFLLLRRLRWWLNDHGFHGFHR
jgi:hypothetical protein